MSRRLFLSSNKNPGKNSCFYVLTELAVEIKNWPGKVYHTVLITVDENFQELPCCYYSRYLCLMLNEIFQITVNDINYHIVTSLPEGPNSVDHEVWSGDELLFVINPRLDKCDAPCWQLTSGYMESKWNKALVQRIGEEIERHYL